MKIFAFILCERALRRHSHRIKMRVKLFRCFPRKFNFFRFRYIWMDPNAELESVSAYKHYVLQNREMPQSTYNYLSKRPRELGQWYYTGNSNKWYVSNCK